MLSDRHTDLYQKVKSKPIAVVIQLVPLWLAGLV
jgi:hypothetical protein